MARPSRARLSLPTRCSARTLRPSASRRRIKLAPRWPLPPVTKIIAPRCPGYRRASTFYTLCRARLKNFSTVGGRAFLACGIAPRACDFASAIAAPRVQCLTVRRAPCESVGAMPEPRFYLRRLALAHGAHSYAQEEMADRMRRRLASVPDAEATSQVVGFVYGHSGIQRRFFELPLQEIEKRGDWYRMTNQASHAMATRALGALLGDELPASACDALIVVSSSYAGFPSLSRRLQEQFSFPVETQCWDLAALGCELPASACDALIVVSSSYAGFPSLSRRLQEQFSFPVETQCWDLAALGCAGPTHGIAMAQALLEAGACKNACVVCVDAFGTHGEARRHKAPPTMAMLVAHCLASDGAAAFVVGRDPGPRPLLSYRSCKLVSRLWPGSLDQNDFTADQDNQPLISVGKEIRTRIGDELAKVLDDDSLREPLFVHPGGAALMRLLRERYPPLAATADLSMSVLADHGNLGAPSVLWVLDRALSASFAVAPRFRLVALGPGIVTTLLLVDGVERAAP